MHRSLLASSCRRQAWASFRCQISRLAWQSMRSGSRRSIPPRSRSRSSRETMSCTQRTASPSSPRSCARKWQDASVTTSSSNMQAATSSMCRSSRWTGSPAISARMVRLRASRASIQQTGRVRPAKPGRAQRSLPSTSWTSIRGAQASRAMPSRRIPLSRRRWRQASPIL